MKKKKNHDIMKATDFIIKELKSAGFILHRNNSITTNSMYIKLDYGVCHSLRISDHPGKKHLHYRYNLMTTQDSPIIRRERSSKGYIRTYYPINHILTMVEEIIEARKNLIKLHGERLYKAKMNMNKVHGQDQKGFWAVCHEVK